MQSSLARHSMSNEGGGALTNMPPKHGL